MKQTYFQLGFTLLFFAAMLAGYVFWYTTLSNLSSSVADISAEVDAKNKSAAQTLVAADQLSKLSLEESAVHGYFVVPEDIVPFLEGLQADGASLGAKVNVTSVSSAATPKPHLDLVLKTTGPFDAVFRTAGAIENSPHDIVVSSFTIGATDPTASSTSWSSTMTLQVGTASSSPGTHVSPVPTATSTATTTP
jgi:hypothetical protein